MKEKKECVGFRSSRHCGNVYNWLSNGVVGNPTSLLINQWSNFRH